MVFDVLPLDHRDDQCAKYYASTTPSTTTATKNIRHSELLPGESYPVVSSLVGSFRFGYKVLLATYVRSLRNMFLLYTLQY